MLRRRWRAWKRRQPSRVRYAVVPAGLRAVASGYYRDVRIVEIRTPGVI